MSDLEGFGDVIGNLDVFAEGLKSRAMVAAGEIAAVLDAYAKSHHMWRPRTGATDASTRGTVVEAGDIIDIVLSAGMDYDVFLELAREGKWAWLWPAITANRKRIRAILVRRLGNGSVGGGE